MTFKVVVARVRDEGGSHIEPPLDPRWSELQKLRWHAAVIQVDTGLEVDVAEYGECECRPAHGAPTYGLRIGRHHRHDTYDRLWRSMNDMAYGAEAMIR